MSDVLLGRKQIKELIELRVRCQNQELALESLRVTARILAGTLSQEGIFSPQLKQDLEEQVREMLEIIAEGLSEPAGDEANSGPV